MSSVGVGSKLTQLDSIADVTGAHIDVERHDEKVVVIIRSVLCVYCYAPPLIGGGIKR